MPIYDNDGTANREIGKLYDNNGSVNTQIGYVYDHNGTTNSPIYPPEATQTIYNQSTHTGWWSSFGTNTIDNTGYRYYVGGTNELFSPYIDLTNYTRITITLFVQLPDGGTVGLNFGFCPQSNPNNYVWSQVSGYSQWGNWMGPNLSGTYDISALKGVYRIKQQTVNGPALAHTFLGNSHFTYFVW